MRAYLKTRSIYRRTQVTFYVDKTFSKTVFDFPKSQKIAPVCLIWLFQPTQQLHTIKALFYKVINQIPLNKKKQFMLFTAYFQWLVNNHWLPDIVTTLGTFPMPDVQVLSQCWMSSYFPNTRCPDTFPNTSYLGISSSTRQLNLLLILSYCITASNYINYLDVATERICISK